MNMKILEDKDKLQIIFVAENDAEDKMIAVLSDERKYFVALKGTHATYTTIRNAIIIKQDK